MTCELWVRGIAENGGQVYIDFPTTIAYSAGDPYPVLIQLSQTHPSGCLFYGGAAFDSTGWHSYPEFYTKGDCGEPKHDCLNGGCVKSTDYNTPGKYDNLADCQAGCSKDSPCNGVCVPSADIAALEQAINAAQARLACK